MKAKIKHVEYEKKEQPKVKVVSEKLKLVKTVTISENIKRGTAEIVQLYDTGKKNKKGEPILRSITKHTGKNIKAEEVKEETTESQPIQEPTSELGAGSKEEGI